MNKPSSRLTDFFNKRVVEINTLGVNVSKGLERGTTSRKTIDVMLAVGFTGAAVVSPPLAALTAAGFFVGAAMASLQHKAPSSNKKPPSP